MALTSHHIYLIPGSQLTKQAPRGFSGTDSHLLPYHVFTHTYTTHSTAITKPAAQHKDILCSSHFDFSSFLACCISETPLHIDEFTPES